jgi:2-amino-4-hydroxy-6-hydroxymethyldihydropteridine diphosphokinase
MFYNLVAAGVASLSAEELIRETMSIERSMGRVRSYRNAPRVIDIDLIFVGGRRLRTASLVLPHPRYTEREFVLAPIRELGLGWFDSRMGKAVGRTRGKGRVSRLEQ